MRVILTLALGAAILAASLGLPGVANKPANIVVASPFGLMGSSSY